MKRLLQFLLVPFLLGSAMCQEDLPQSQAAPTPAPLKTCVLAGVVTRSESSEPVRKAMVTLHPVLNGPQDEANQHVVTTDASGRFEIRNVPPGDYRIQVEKNGFQGVRGQGGRGARASLPITLSPGEELRDVVLALQAGVVITGKVVDENGDPMPSVSIRVLRRLFDGSGRTLNVLDYAITDDRGDYRVFGLPAGKFVVQAVPREPLRDSRHAYPQIFYPDAKTPDEASVIALKSGDSTILNFTLLPVPLSRIQGRITGMPVENGRIQIFNREGEFTRDARVGKNGSFTIEALPPGEYTLSALVFGKENRPSAEGSRILRVDGTNADDIEIAVRPLLTSTASLQGSVKLVGNPLSHGDLATLQVSLVPQPGTEPEGRAAMGKVQADGSVRLQNIVPGHYNLHMTTTGPGWEDFYTKTFLFAGRDVTGATVAVSPGSSNLEIQVSGDGAYVEGTVVDENGKPVADATVVGVPETARRSQIDSYQRTTTDAYGRYQLRGIEPGNYTLFAWETMEDWSFMDPEFMAQYESQGTPVLLNSNDHKAVPLVLTPPAP